MTDSRKTGNPDHIDPRTDSERAEDGCVVLNDDAPVLPVSVNTSIQKWASGRCEPIDDHVAEEVPVALVYNGVSHAVMMATPADLEDFALGFSLSEGIVESPGEVYDIRFQDAPKGIAVHLDISPRRFAALKSRRRNLAGRTGCGLCGVDSLDEAVRAIRPVCQTSCFGVDGIVRALDMLPAMQVMNGKMRSLHAAAWAAADGTIELVREDVGRHNAMDKLIGAMAREGRCTDGGFVIATSRCSYEMAQKATAAGAAMLVTISAPTALALRLAEDAGLIVVALGRGDTLRAYTHHQRLLPGFDKDADARPRPLQ
ncbi:MAG: formate dehydrogenase accessory sulfurtransferase FdhD [Rhodospirillales bacterium]|nr:formate dehydrogenase accessory sulfurtransferase FdhD [Rhodospirillales bacterium]